MLSLRAQRSNLVAAESSPPEIATSPSAPRNDEFSFVLGEAWQRRLERFRIVEPAVVDS